MMVTLMNAFTLLLHADQLQDAANAANVSFISGTEKDEKHKDVMFSTSK